MARIDRYMLSQLLLLFGFFALVLVGLFWINRAVVLFDRLIEDGQSALVFLEFTALGLPRLIATVLPIAAFAAAVYVTNRMSSESELTVLQSMGNGPMRLARPMLVFGVLVALMMSALSHFLVPIAQSQLAQREAEISQNVTAGLLREGRFLHPAPNVTFYTRTIEDDGVLRDVFLSDRRNNSEGVIYTAAEAYLVQAGTGTTLIMLDGTAQRLERESNRLATARFRDFSFDISTLVRERADGLQSVANMTTPALIAGAHLGDEDAGIIAEELHSRFAQPLFCIVAALVGFATLLSAGYSRFGIWREVIIAFLLLIAIDGLRGSLVDLVRSNADRWALLYVPTLMGGALVATLLTAVTYPGIWRSMRRQAGGAT